MFVMSSAVYQQSTSLNPWDICHYRTVLDKILVHFRIIIIHESKHLQIVGELNL